MARGDTFNVYVHGEEVDVGRRGKWEDDPLPLIRGAARATAHVDRILTELVEHARRRGHTWKEIAAALGVTRQSAWERFKNVDSERQDVISQVLGSLKGPGPSTDEMRRMAREEEAEIEERGKTP